METLDITARRIIMSTQFQIMMLLFKKMVQPKVVFHKNFDEFVRFQESY